jgi:hypothetical protein
MLITEIEAIIITAIILELAIPLLILTRSRTANRHNKTPQ